MVYSAYLVVDKLRVVCKRNVEKQYIWYQREGRSWPLRRRPLRARTHHTGFHARLPALSVTAGRNCVLFTTKAFMETMAAGGDFPHLGKGFFPARLLSVKVCVGARVCLQYVFAVGFTQLFEDLTMTSRNMLQACRPQ